MATYKPRPDIVIRDKYGVIIPLTGIEIANPRDPYYSRLIKDGDLVEMKPAASPTKKEGSNG